MAAHRAGGCVTGSGHAPRLAVARCLGLILRLTSAFMRRSGSGADGRSPSLRVTAAGAPGAVGEVRMRVHAPGSADGRAGGGGAGQAGTWPADLSGLLPACAPGGGVSLDGLAGGGLSPGMRPFPAVNCLHSLADPTGLLQVPFSPASVMAGRPESAPFPRQTRGNGFRARTARNRHFPLHAMNGGRPAASASPPRIGLHRLAPWPGLGHQVQC